MCCHLLRPMAKGGVRFSVTAANTDSDIERALSALAAARDANTTETASGFLNLIR